MTVTGTQVVGTEIASVFTSTTTSDPTPTNELVVKRPGGVYVLSDPSTEPPFDQLYPSMILPFPLAVVAPTEQVSCHALDVGDLDGDGRADHADLVVSPRVFSMAETADVQAGHFADVAHVQITAHVTVTATIGGTVVVDATQDDWYARDVGRVVSRVILTAPGMSQSSTSSLLSWTVPMAADGPATVQALTRPASARSRAPRLEDAALQLARRAVGAPR
jgi:hypothetical protein